VLILRDSPRSSFLIGIVMNWDAIETKFSLHDPETGFAFQSREGNVVVSFLDWQNRQITIDFIDVAKFSYSWLSPYPGIADQGFYVADRSNYVDLLTETTLIGKEQRLHHYLIANNEDEWCEVVADTYNIQIET
jgi:hypothetical protein